MPSDDPDFSLKRLRELCLGIREPNIAILLQTVLPDFPVDVVDEFFLGPKLNKPSGPDDREWTDIVRLTLIAFAPSGSEPARLRGTALERYNSDPVRPNDDEPGVLTLYPCEKTSPILGDIAAALGVTKLIIQSTKWLRRYLAKPFELKELSVSFRESYSFQWQPIPGLKSDFSELISVLPQSLECLRLRMSTNLPLGGDSLAKLGSLKLLDLEVDSLPNGLDFSANKALEHVTIDVRSGAGVVIKGFASLDLVEVLNVNCFSGSIALDSLDTLLSRGIQKLRLKGVAYLSERLEGLLPYECILSDVTGIKRINLSPNTAQSEYPSTKAEFSKVLDLETCEVDGDTTKVSIKNCPKLADLKVRIASDRQSDLEISSCPLLSKAEVEFLNGADDIFIDNVPSLGNITLTSPSGRGPRYSNRANLFIGKTALTRPPEFKGAWKGLSVIELEDHPQLEFLQGLEILPDLEEVHIRKIPAMKGILPAGSKTTFPLVSWFRADNVTLPKPAGFEAMPNLTKLDLISCTLGGLEGVESLQCLDTVDLSSSAVPSIAPLAGLSALKSVRVSGCSGLKPKPPHVLLEGLELASELARAAGPSSSGVRRGPTEELTKVVQLIGEGSGPDVIQAINLLSVLSPEEQTRILTGAVIDSKTRWVRIPFLTKIKDEEAMGIPQSKILQGLGGKRVEEILSQVTSIVINDDDREESMLRLGAKPKSGNDDSILEMFESLGSLPELYHVTMISINYLSRFSLEGIEKFPNLTSLFVRNVDCLEGLDSLGRFGGLQKLSITGVDLKNLATIGVHPALEELQVHKSLETLEGLENFPSLKTLCIHSSWDISAIFAPAAKRNYRISCDTYSDYRYKGDVLRFELRSR